jgi:hypothetical protein
MTTKVKPTAFDVIAVSISSGKVRMIATGKSERNADAIVSMACMRRGVAEEFFTEAPSGKYKDGDTYTTAS